MGSTQVEKLSDEQVHALLVEYLATRDVQLRDRIVLQYKNLVESVARRFAGSGEPLEDLVQEGFIGLITATDLYDADKGVKFSTYATHFIIGQIKHALRDRGKIIKEPAWLQELNHRMTRVIDSLYQELGRQPTDAEIGKVMHLPEETVADLLTTREIFKVASLDCEQDESSPGGVDVEKVKTEKYTTFQLPVEDKIVLETAMNKLKLIEQKVIHEFYYTGLTQTEIAKKLGISCNYVSHILRSGTRKLRRILTTEEIREVQMQLQLASRRAESLQTQTEADVVDTLTGAYTADYLNARLEEEVSRAARAKLGLGFAIVALDGMDEIAARCGAMRHDDLLCELVQTLKNSVRKCDVVGRTKEHELGIILLYANGCGDAVCTRVLKALAQIQSTANDGGPAVHPRIGYASYPSDGTNAADLMACARRRLGEDQTRVSRKAA